MSESTRPLPASSGYGGVIRIALPLVISTSSATIQLFVDRMFLAWHSPEDIAAAMPAGLLQLTLISFFIGTAGYVNTFVAQYHGAERNARVGPAIWQAIYFSLIAGLVLPLIVPLAPAIFRLAGHPPAIQALEADYFRILMLGAFFPIYSSAVQCFYTGLGRNWPVLWVNIMATLINVALDYALIFGRWGFPAWGIAGAAWATNVANAAGALAFTVILLQRRNRREFRILAGWRIDRGLLGRLLRFGAPAGVQFMLEMTAFTLFIMMVGRIGVDELTATTVAFQINTLAFMPMIGFGVAVTTLVGQWLGRGRADVAARATWSALHLTLLYMTAIAAAYVLLPGPFIDLFTRRAAPGSFAQIRPLAVVILRFVAAYCVLDTMNVIMASALKGAGDTRFVMVYSVVLGWVVMVIPTWIFCGQPGGSITLAWTFLTVYVNLTGMIYLARFLQGKWRTMRVIESAPERAGE